jgi:GH35 family endo-1,4-beta-xylanase
VKLPRATLDREAKRQGQRAQRLRTALDQQAAPQKRQLELRLEPYQMIIQLDAWNIRERDAWGAGHKRASGWTFTTPCNIWPRWAARSMATTKKN